MADVLPLPKARVPVVKFVVPKTGTKVGCWASAGLRVRGAAAIRAIEQAAAVCNPAHHSPCCRPLPATQQVDVTVNNMLACANTKLLADYCAIDGRLAPLVALVKHWAKNRAVNDAYRGGRGCDEGWRALVVGHRRQGCTAHRARHHAPPGPLTPGNSHTLPHCPLPPCRRHAVQLLLRADVHPPTADAARARAAGAAAAAAHLPAHRGPVDLRVLRRREQGGQGLYAWLVMEGEAQAHVACVSAPCLLLASATEPLCCCRAVCSS